MSYTERLRLFLLVITNSGGEGKTWVTMLLLTVLKLLDHDVLTIDGDPGNRAASVADIGAKAMDVFEEPEKLSHRISKSLDGTKSLLIDAGANILAVSVGFGDAMRDVGFKLQDEGYRVNGLWIVSTNKIGAAQSAGLAARRFGQPFAPLWLFNDRDGSGAVPEGMQPDITVAHLEPGYVSLVNEAGGFEPIVRVGIPGYQISADVIAQYVWQFVDQPGMRALLGAAAVDGLRPMLERVTLNVRPLRVAQKANDDEMVQKAAHAEVLRAVMPCQSNIDAIIRALEELKIRRG